MDTQEILKKAALLKRNPNLANVIPNSEIIALVTDVLGAFAELKSAIETNKLKGDKGDPATPLVAGVDYPSFDQIDGVLSTALSDYGTKYQNLQNELQKAISRASELTNGKDAEITDDLIEEVAELASSLIELPDFDTLVSTEITRNSEAIRNALELLQGDDRLDASAIKGLENFVKTVYVNGGGGIGKNQVYNFIAQAVADGTIPTGGTGSLPSGGTVGQVLTKQSSTDGDADWETLSTGGSSEWIVVSSNQTAAIDAQYSNVATATYTDPTPVEGKGFIVLVRNGTATVGGTGYSTAGTKIYRFFHSGAWANYVYQTGGGSGDVVGPASATDNAIARFDSTTGKLIQDSQWQISDNGALSPVGNPYGVGKVIRNQYLEIGNTDLNRLPYTAYNARLTNSTGANEFTPVYAGDASASMGILQGGAGSGNLSFLTLVHGLTATAANLTSFVQRLFIRASDGFIKIGAGAPTERLDVDGNGKFSGRVEVLNSLRMNGFGVANGLESIGTMFLNAGYDNTGNEQIDMAINGVTRVNVNPAGVLTVTNGELNLTDNLKLERINIDVPVSTAMPVTLNAEHGTTLNQGWWYRVTAMTATGGETGTVAVAFYNGISWILRIVSERTSTSQNPRFQITGNTLEVFHNNLTQTYNMRLLIESRPKPAGSTNMSLNALGADGMWQRVDTDLSFLDGRVGVGIVPQTRLHVRDASNAATVEVLRLEGDRSTPATNDAITQSFVLSNNVGTQTQFARIIAQATDITAGSEDGRLYFGVDADGTLTNQLILDKSGLFPQTNDLIPLGRGNNQFSDLFLASGGVVNFNNGNATLTHSAGLLTSNVDIVVPDEAYDATAWNGSLEVPTKNAVRDKIDAMDAAIALNTAKVTNATHTGEVTGATALTIANDVVTNAKLANVATATFKGRTTAGTGDPEDLTATQATALLNVFDSSLKGLAPASGGGTSNFLRADGTWAAPAGGGGGAVDEMTKAVAQTGHGFAVGDIIRHNGTAYTKSQGNNGANAEIVGIVSTVTDANNFTFSMPGSYIEGLSGRTAGETYFLDPTTAGAMTITEPTTVGQIRRPVFFAVSTTAGVFDPQLGIVIGETSVAQTSAHVIHGSTASTSRPSVDYVIWTGSVEPTNMADNDIWNEVA